MERNCSVRFFVVLSVISVCLISISLSEAGVVSYDFCLQDDSSGITLQINSATGDYKFKRCSDGFTETGKGAMTIRGSSYSLQDNPGDRMVSSSWSTSTNIGTASVRIPLGAPVNTISDHNITNNNCGS
jgi:hypothetical protein